MSIVIIPDFKTEDSLLFDVTPHKYVTAIVTEKGAFRPRDLKKLMKKDVNIERFRIKP